MEAEKQSKKLKHLGFVRLAAIQTFVYVSNLYDYAKQNSGSLKSAVNSVEKAVTTVVTPVCTKFKDLPDDLLGFVDKKVDEGMEKFDKHAPPVAKQVAGQAKGLMEAAIQKGQELVNEARTGGPRAAVHFAARESKDFALTQSVRLWFKANKFPLIHTVADITIPTAAHWSEKYNHVVKNMTEKGYTGFGYLPLIPVDEIAKAFKQGKAEKKEDVDTQKSDSSDSD